MECKEEGTEVNSVPTDPIDNSTRTSSVDDPEQETPTTSTESEEVTSAESAPSETTEKSADKDPQVDKSLKNVEAEVKQVQDNKNENKDGNKDATTGKDQHKSESEESDDDEEAVLESSPCGRWHKRKEQVSNLSFLQIYAVCFFLMNMFDKYSLNC